MACTYTAISAPVRLMNARPGEAYTAHCGALHVPCGRCCMRRAPASTAVTHVYCAFTNPTPVHQPPRVRLSHGVPHMRVQQPPHAACTITTAWPALRRQSRYGSVRGQGNQHSPRHAATCNIYVQDCFDNRQPHACMARSAARTCLQLQRSKKRHDCAPHLQLYCSATFVASMQTTHSARYHCIARLHGRQRFADYHAAAATLEPAA